MSSRNGDGGTMKKKIMIGSISCLMVAAVVAGVVVGVKNKGSNDDDSSTGEAPKISTSTKAITTFCQPTDYKEACVKSLKSSRTNSSDPKELMTIGFMAAIDALKVALKNSSTLNDVAKDSRNKQALRNCQDLMNSSIDDLTNSVNHMRTFEFRNVRDFFENIKIWLSGAITFQESCLDEFENTTGEAGGKMKKMLNGSRMLTSNSLAMVSAMSSAANSFRMNKNNRRLLNNDIVHDVAEDGVPSWVNGKLRKLLQETPETINPDVVVALDGSGKYKTITEALKEVPKDNNKTFVIYIKPGIYKEYVEVGKHMTNVMFIGDDPRKTMITGNKNYVDGINTMNTATVAILGPNFMAKNIGFENTAGAINHQAVALRVQAHMSVFYNCLMEGYQDTLYAHAHGQYYRDCTITGTIDFIFGNAAAVFQNCKLINKKPMENQQCIATAQGRTNVHEPTGFVLQNCTITGDPEYWPMKDVNKAFLGRPWKQYSRTVIMQSQIDSLIQPDGWLPWEGDFALDTLYFAEYDNRGPGAVQNQRVKWAGIKQLTAQSANDFTLGNFIGDTWIKPTGVPYVYGMM